MVYFRGSKVQAYGGSNAPKQEVLSYIVLPEGFRMISSEDAGKAFSTGEPMMDRFGLNYYYMRSLRPDTIAIVLEHGNEIAGAALLLVEKGSITVEMLAKNAYVDEKGVGVRLLNCIEECVAEQLMINSIRLDALDREKLLEFYRNRGFVPEGRAVFDREWGILHPMRKRIASIGS